MKVSGLALRGQVVAHRSKKEDNNLGQVRRPFGLSKEGLGAKGGEEEGGQNWRIQSNFFIVKASCVSE